LGGEDTDVRSKRIIFQNRQGKGKTCCAELGGELGKMGKNRALSPNEIQK